MQIEGGGVTLVRAFVYITIPHVLTSYFFI